MKSTLLLAVFCLFSSAHSIHAQEKKDTIRHKKGGYYNGFESRHFGYGYWMLGLYAGTENFETVDFGINFPISNQNYSGRFFRKIQKNRDTIVNRSSFGGQDFCQEFYRYRIAGLNSDPVKRSALQLGLERNLMSLVYRPEVGLVFTPFPFIGVVPKGINPRLRNFKMTIDHILFSVDYLPAIRSYQPIVRVGAGYMIKLRGPLFQNLRYNAIRFYFLYHYQISDDWSGHVFTLQLNYNKEPLYSRFNPAKSGYRYP